MFQALRKRLAADFAVANRMVDEGRHPFFRKASWYEKLKLSVFLLAFPYMAIPPVKLHVDLLYVGIDSHIRHGTNILGPYHSYHLYKQWNDLNETAQHILNNRDGTQEETEQLIKLQFKMLDLEREAYRAMVPDDTSGKTPETEVFSLPMVP